MTCGAGFDILDIMSNLHRECGTRKNDYSFMDAGIPSGVPACIKKALLKESPDEDG